MTSTVLSNTAVRFPGFSGNSRQAYPGVFQKNRDSKPRFSAERCAPSKPRFAPHQKPRFWPEIAILSTAVFLRGFSGNSRQTFPGFVQKNRDSKSRFTAEHRVQIKPGFPVFQKPGFPGITHFITAICLAEKT